MTADLTIKSALQFGLGLKSFWAVDQGRLCRFVLDLISTPNLASATRQFRSMMFQNLVESFLLVCQEKPWIGPHVS